MSFFVEVSFQNGFRAGNSFTFDLLPDFLNLFLPLLVLALNSILLLGLVVSIGKYFVNSEIDLPENPLDEGAKDEHYHKVHEAKIEHDVAVVLGVSPAVVKGHSGPSLLYHDLDHHKLGLEEVSEGGELGIAVVLRRARCGIGVVEELHTQDCEGEEGEEDEGDELEDDGHYFQQHLKQHFKFDEETEFDLEEVAVRNDPQQTGHSEYPPYFRNTAGPTLNGQEEEQKPKKDQHRVQVVPPLCKEVFRPEPNYP